MLREIFIWKKKNGGVILGKKEKHIRAHVCTHAHTHVCTHARAHTQAWNYALMQIQGMVMCVCVCVLMTVTVR